MSTYIHNELTDVPLCDMCGNHFNLFVMVGDMAFCEKCQRIIVSMVRKLIIDRTHTIKKIATKPTTLSSLRRGH